MLVEHLGVSLEERAHGRRGGSRCERVRLFIDGLPHTPLVGHPAVHGANRLPDILELFGSPARILNAVADAEIGTVVRPPPRFNARDGNVRGLCRRDQHGEIGDPVLLGADQFLAIDDEEGELRPVIHREFGNASAFGHLPDGYQILAQSILQQEVAQIAPQLRGEGNDGQPLVSSRLSERQRGEGGLDLVQLVPPYMLSVSNHYLNSNREVQLCQQSLAVI